MSYNNHQLPTPAQLHTLAGIGMSFAREQRRLKASHRQSQAYGFLPPQLELIEEDADRNIEKTHRVIGRIGKIAAREWSLRLRESYWIRSEDEDTGIINTFKFAWNNNETTIASKTSIIAPTYKEPEFIDIVERAIDTGLDIDSSLWHAQMQYEQVTAEDCAVLITDVEILYKQIKEYAQQSDYLASMIA